tara:strand:- start:97 stop:309 length:213 start_codon:yes stop_codon:yes gene_type:complete
MQFKTEILDGFPVGATSYSPSLRVVWRDLVAEAVGVPAIAIVTIAGVFVVIIFIGVFYRSWVAGARSWPQ